MSPERRSAERQSLKLYSDNLHSLHFQVESGGEGKRNSRVKNHDLLEFLIAFKKMAMFLKNLFLRGIRFNGLSGLSFFFQQKVHLFGTHQYSYSCNEGKED